MSRVFASLLAMLVGLLSVPGCVLAQDTVVELLRLQVPVSERQVWLDAEARTWQPWLEQQQGFLSRDLYWDAALEQGVLLIRWASREQWKAISPEEVERVQRQFDADVNTSLGRPSLSKSAFPLVAETELLPLP